MTTLDARGVRAAITQRTFRSEGRRGTVTSVRCCIDAPRVCDGFAVRTRSCPAVRTAPSILATPASPCSASRAIIAASRWSVRCAVMSDRGAPANLPPSNRRRGRFGSSCADGSAASAVRRAAATLCGIRLAVATGRRRSSRRLRSCSQEGRSSTRRRRSGRD